MQLNGFQLAIVYYAPRHNLRLAASYSRNKRRPRWQH